MKGNEHMTKTSYKLRPSMYNGKQYGWEVAHEWADGVTIQVRHFTTLRAARIYLASKGANNV
jgi:hypothetical protein